MCTDGKLRISLMTLNVVFFLVGGIVLGVGIWLYFGDGSSITKLVGNIPLLKSASLALILIGAVSFIPALFGCCGACMKIRLFLLLYVIIIVIFLLIELGVIIALATMRSQVETLVTNEAQSSLSTYKDGIRFSDGNLVLPSSAQDLVWDTLHIKFKCCGIHGSADFAKAPASFNWERVYAVNGRNVTAVIPPSCCKMSDTSLEAFPLELSKVSFNVGTELDKCIVNQTDSYSLGCKQAMTDYIAERLVAVIVTGAVIIVLEIVGIAIASQLYRQLKKDDE